MVNIRNRRRGHEKKTKQTHMCVVGFERETARSGKKKKKELISCEKLKTFSGLNLESQPLNQLNASNHLSGPGRQTDQGFAAWRSQAGGVCHVCGVGTPFMVLRGNQKENQTILRGPPFKKDTGIPGTPKLHSLVRGNHARTPKPNVLFVFYNNMFKRISL